MTQPTEELERRERQLAAAQHVAQIGSWEWDIEADRIIWSAELYRIFGIEGQAFEATYEAFLACVHPVDRERVNAVIDEAFRSHAPFAFDHRIVRPDGTERVVHGRGEIVVDAAGAPVRMNGTCQDITERQCAEDQARQARNEAEQANHSKTEFLSRMSHELRTPLNAVIGFAQLLDMSRLTSDQRDGVDHILRGSRHLLALIEEVLDIAQIEQGQLAVSIEPVCVAEVAADVLGLVTPMAAQRGVLLRQEPIPSGLHVAADRQRLKQVLMNLLSNAIKYNEDRGQVIVACERSPSGRVRLTVTDTGPGIAPDKLERLFEPFERLGAERTTIEGTGIGLALSKRLAALMDGSIDVHSVPGEGSRFAVELACAETPEETLTEPDQNEAPEVPQKERRIRTVLYVEDNLASLSLLERIFARRADVHLLVAMQGRLGLELAAQQRPDLILLDVHLPDINGDEVLRRLQADPVTRVIPVVTLSAEATPAKIKRFLEAGARHYVTKPLDVPRFLALVDEVFVGTRGRDGIDAA